MKSWLFGLSLCLLLQPALLSAEDPPVIVVAEGERFAPQDEKGWKVTHQDHSLASQNFGGMWATFGGLLGASAESEGSLATQTVQIPAAGDYRIWSKYQSPPYFNFAHRVEIVQNGKTVFSHDYGKLDAERMYSFFGKTVYGLPPKKQVWFSWGVDHDAAEAPTKLVNLQAGPAEIRLTTLKQDALAGDRFIDFVLLTTQTADTCIGWDQGGQAKSPFTYEALRATPLMVRFRNTTSQPANAVLFTHMGHFTWHCAPKKGTFPEQPVPVGQWSPWFNVNQVVELLTAEGVQISLLDASSGDPNTASKQIENVEVPIQISLDPNAGKMLGDFVIHNGETIHIPLDITWNPERKIERSKDIAAKLVQQSKVDWRKASPHKPKHIAFYGAFRSEEPWAIELKDALGYNTLLPEQYQTLEVDGYHQHLYDADQIRTFAEKLGDERKHFRVCSFGDEISLGEINSNDPQYEAPFRQWLQSKGLTKADLGVEPSEAKLNGNSRLEWYSKLFSAEQRFTHYRELTKVAKDAFGPQVLTGANYSPHHDVMYYGNQLQWIDAFKHNAMSMFWTEDYIFFVPELPQTISFMFARMHCATKYHHQPIHMYVMPHAPGQPAEYFRRNSLYSIGAGAKHIDHFWVAPEENFTENYVSWEYPETFREIFETIHDTAAVEEVLIDAQRRPAKVAIITGKATALNEDKAPVDVQQDEFLRMSHLAGKPQQNICRKDQQALYFALRHAQVEVDLITEDDIIEDNILKNYQVVYFSGEWINNRAVEPLNQWVQAGGTLYASTGLGHLNQFNEPEESFQKLLGVKATAPKKNLYHVRPLLELPLAKPIGEITLDAELVKQSAAENADPSTISQSLPAIAFRQDFTLIDPQAVVVGKWEDGQPAVAMRKHGQGTVITVGTAAGLTYLKTGTKPVPWARGGWKHLYNPVDFSPAAVAFAHLGLKPSPVAHQVLSSNPHVESLLLDNSKGTLLTLVNWTNEKEFADLQLVVKSEFKPSQVFSVTQQKPLMHDYNPERKTVTFKTNLTSADYIVLLK